MKQTIHILRLIVALMLALPLHTFANERESELTNSIHNMVLPLGNGLYSIKVPVYIGSAGGNYWAATNGQSAIYVEAGGTRYELLSFKANNYDNNSGDTNTMQVRVDRHNKDLGLCIFTNADGTKFETQGGTDRWDNLRVRMAKTMDNEYNMTFLEFEWQAKKQTFDQKEITFSVDHHFSKYFGVDYVKEQKLGTFFFSSNLMAPVIAGAYVNPNAIAGYEGQVVLTAACAKAPETVRLLESGKVIYTSNATNNAIEIMLPQCDTTRVVQVQVVCRQNNLPETLTSAPYTILPYHKIRETKCEELRYRFPTDSAGYKRLKWTIDTATSDDMFDSDGFVIERAYRNDMSDAEQVGSVHFADTVRAGEYEWVDASTGAVFNELGGDKTYYRVSRTTAAALFSTPNNCYAVTDSVANKVGFQPKVTKVIAAEDGEFKYNRKANVTIYFNLDKYYKYAGDYHRAKWNDNTSVKLYVIRRHTDGTLLGTDSVDVDTKTLKFDALNNEYVLTRDYVLTEPGAQYYFKAKAEISAETPNVKFAISNYDNDPTQDLGVETEASMTYRDLTPVRGIKATSGTEYGVVRVSWERPATRIDSLEVLRRAEGGEWESLAWADPTTEYYIDETAELNVTYEYAIATVVNYRGGRAEADSRETDDEVAKGWISPVGKITGKITTREGDYALGGQRVQLTDTSGGSRLEAITEEDGTFCFDRLTISNEGKAYEIVVPSTSLTFEYNGANTSAKVVLTARGAMKDNVNFVCTSVKRFNGRVLFDNSTVPVAGAMFRINGKVVHDAAGLPVKTDNMGNFEFFVPQQEVAVQVFKPGHRFDEDGYILHPKTGAKKFTPSDDLLEILLYDQTKVLLRGRIIGGNTLAAKPLGQGLTKNNLGDNITLQLKLEGNNVANFVYIKDKPNKDSIVVYDEQKWKDNVVTRTRGDFYRKQIDIHVDNQTGEYAIPLFPTKYKVVQAFAQGYASLFAKGEAAQVLDLTDSVSTDSTRTALATHSITYHSDVDITYAQLQYGVTELPHLGAEELNDQNIFGEEVKAKLAWVDEQDSVHYMLGAPLFRTGELYVLRGTAHEDYYYNNVSTGAHYQEPITGGVVRVENGLAAANPTTETFRLNDKGQFTVRFTAGNDNFALTGEDAMRQLNSSVEVNGLYYQSSPLKAYVTGERDKQGAVFNAKNVDINLFDILRDPTGANGYSYYGKGKRYSMTRDYNFSFGIGAKLDISSGASYNTIVGVIGGTVLTGTSTSGSTKIGTSIEIPVFSGSLKHSARYDFTATDRIQTSSDPQDVGAMADVYIGATTDFIAQVKETICVIDNKTYNAMKPSIDAGLIKMICRGTAKNDSVYYLVTAEKLQPGYTLPSTFVYSQRHILSVIIPGLMAERNSLLYGGDGVTKEMVEAMAVREGKTLYYYKGTNLADAALGKYGVDYVACYPGKEKDGIDAIEQYNNQIKKWIDMIALNEELKVKAAANDSVINYSLSAGQKISYSEQMAYCDEGEAQPLSFLGFSTSAKANKQSVASWVNKLAKSAVDWKLEDGIPLSKGNDSEKRQEELKKKFVESFGKLFDDSAQGNTNKAQAGNNITTFNTPVAQLEFKVTPNVNIDYSNKSDGDKLITYESGYEMELADDSYANISVYKVPTKSLGEEYDKMKEAHDFVTGKSDETELLHQYIFVVNGGATRNPWCDADSTIFYNTGTPLGIRTLKIDNPVLTLSATEMSNVPEDEKATFSVRLTNDSELVGSTSTSHPSTFTLSLVDESNAKGAKVTMDGAPLSDGRTFTIAPGESILKTFEVMRGVGYDFEGLQLKLASADNKNISLADFNVHFQRASSPVSISAPTDKWVMNTFSARDDNGYYIPIVVEGYDINYNNFDHIEIQYKKSTEGEASWVNLCSYFANDSLYEAASGTKSKEQIRTGKITHSFYGEQDPIEMKYDIRAVTFCRLGTSFVTRSSNVISGTKDTRRPEVFGQSQPLNGILTADGNIMLPFSEPIAYNYLDRTANFDIRGYKNSSAIDTNVGLVFDGSSAQDACTQVTRNLDSRSFTVDMIVQPDEDHKEMTFFSQAGSDEGLTFTFGIDASRRLFAECCGEVVRSKPLDQPLNQVPTHVGVIYTYEDISNMEAKTTARFFAGNTILPCEGDDYILPVHRGNAVLHFGTSADFAPFKGRMLEARLWNRALDADMVSLYDKKSLDGYCSQIIGYWPMRQTEGKAADRVNGADLTLSKGVNWYTSDGYSLAIKGKTFHLEADPFQRSAKTDYTLAFWMKMSQASANAQIFAAGSDKMAGADKDKLRIGFAKGKLRMVSNDTTFVDAHRSLDSLADNAWHHFAFSVSHTQNLVGIYIDGMLVAQQAADGIGGITSESIKLGSDSLTANIDELALWHQALPQSFVNNIRKYNIQGDEMGLWVYLPFDYTAENSQGTTSLQFTTKNYAKGNTSFFEQNIIKNVDEKTDQQNTCAPLIAQSLLSKHSFKWSSDGTNLLIKLDMKKSDINKQNIFLTVRDVEDLNGNTMANPYSWTIYTDLNTLRWENEGKPFVMSQNEESHGELSWKNITANRTNYRVRTSTPYIKVDDGNVLEGVISGVAEPNKTYNWEYEVSKDLAPGKYVEYIWLEDADNAMISTYTLNFTVEPHDPDWEVDTKKYDQTMSVMATVTMHKNGAPVVVIDPDDKIGVFVGSACVGSANIKNEAAAQLFLTVYGNRDTEGRELVFYHFDHSTGTVTQLDADRDVTFKANDRIGMPPAEPLHLTSSETKMQNFDLAAGWNWISLNVSPVNTALAKGALFSNGAFHDGDVFKSDSQHAEYSEAKDKWQLDQIKLSHHNIYHVYVNQATRFSVIGRQLTDSERVIHVKQGWNNLPFLSTNSLPIARAMADYQNHDKATAGDIIKGYDSFAVLTDGFNWVGTLTELKPGEGYYLLHNGQNETDIVINNTQNVANQKAKPKRTTAATGEHNMIVIAAVAEGEDIADDATVQVTNGTATVCAAEPITLPDGTKRYFITVPETAGSVQFMMNNTADTPTAVGTVKFNATTCVGTLAEPFILTTKQTESDSDRLYDLSGRRVTHTQPHNVYVKKGSKMAK